MNRRLTIAQQVISLPELELLPHLEPGRSPRSWAVLLACSLVFELFVFDGFLRLAQVPVQPMKPEARRVFQQVRLYMPPDVMTQRAPNRAKPTPRIDLADLLASQQHQQRTPTPAPAPKHFEVPKPASPKATPAPNASPAPPQIAAAVGPSQPVPGVVNGLQIQAPPPPSADHPFQDIGDEAPARNDHPTLHAPKASVDAAIQSLAQTPDARHLVISDGSNSPRLRPGMPGSVNMPGTQHMQVELKSDTDAPDFREYLTRILAIVRANWRRVTPESVRMGTVRGRNTVELVINRDGQIPKLVIGQPSNLEALDRASVAGVSMSNPLPPLPADFKGQQVRIAFTFDYNMPQ